MAMHLFLVFNINYNPWSVVHGVPIPVLQRQYI